MESTEQQVLELARGYALQAEEPALEAVKTVFMRGRGFGFRVCYTKPLADRDVRSRIMAAANLLLFVVTGTPTNLDLSTLPTSTRLYQDAELLVANTAPA